MPYIVRVERGVLNRGIYDLAVLYDPARPWTSLEPQPQWNGKVVFQFGFANGHPRRQVRPMTAWTDSGIGIGPTIALGRGYLVAANSMTDSMSNSNRVVMAETLMMMKEHIVERYGEIRFAIGTGGSGGALNAIIGASIAPGVLDGVVLAGALPDGQTLQVMPDCALLVAAYQQPAWLKVLSAGGYPVEQINAKKRRSTATPIRPAATVLRHVLDDGARQLPAAVRGCDHWRDQHAADRDQQLRAACASVVAMLKPTRAARAAMKARGPRRSGATCPARRSSLNGTRDNVGVQYGFGGVAQRRDHGRGVRHVERLLRRFRPRQ